MNTYSGTKGLQLVSQIKENGWECGWKDNQFQTLQFICRKGESQKGELHTIPDVLPLPLQFIV